MVKLITRVVAVLIISQLFFVFFLSFYGIETTYFNSTIRNKVKSFNPNLNLEFQKTYILLDLKQLGLKVKIKNPKISFNEKSTNLSKLNLNMSIKSFLKNEFALRHWEIGLFKTETKQLVELANQIQPSPFLIIVRKIFDNGNIEGEARINFDSSGKILDDYKISGSLSDFNKKIFKKYDINQATSKFELFKNNYNFYITKGNINKINLTDSEFTINQEGKNFSINGNLVSKANLKNIQNTLDLFKINLLRGKTEQAEISFNIKSSLSLKLKKYVRLENLKFNGSGKINFLNIKHKINTSKLKKKHLLTITTLFRLKTQK